MSYRNLTETTWRETRESAPDAIALLPVGSQEQHAEHLPMGTDTLLVEAVLDRALALLDAEAAGEAPALVRLPTLPYGHSPHHLFAAALTLSASTLGAVLGEILDSLAACGHRRILVGQRPRRQRRDHEARRQALRPARRGHRSRLLVLDRDRRGGGRRPPDVTPGHAGWFETSLMLAAHPGLVRTPVPGTRPRRPAAALRPAALPGAHRRAARGVGARRRLHRRRLGRRRRSGRRLLDDRARGLARAVLRLRRRDPHRTRERTAPAAAPAPPAPAPRATPKPTEEQHEDHRCRRPRREPAPAQPVHQLLRDEDRRDPHRRAHPHRHRGRGLGRDHVGPARRRDRQDPRRGPHRAPAPSPWRPSTASSTWCRSSTATSATPRSPPSTSPAGTPWARPPASPSPTCWADPYARRSRSPR